MKIDKANLAHVATKDRWCRGNTIRFGPHGTESTDGKRALRIPYADADGVSEDTDTQVDAHHAVATLRLKKRAEPVSAEANGNVTVRTGGGSVTVLPADNTGVPFPKLDSVFPKGEPAMTFTVTASLLADLAKQMALVADIRCPGGIGALTIDVFQDATEKVPTRPIRLTLRGVEGCVGLLMPVSMR
tara:strand:+ start:888 stop:1448 length:561 start_codon:yes stop_codon:yes gene_type:complete